MNFSFLFWWWRRSNIPVEDFDFNVNSKTINEITENPNVHQKWFIIVYLGVNINIEITLFYRAALSFHPFFPKNLIKFSVSLREKGIKRRVTSCRKDVRLLKQTDLSLSLSLFGCICWVCAIYHWDKTWETIRDVSFF